MAKNKKNSKKSVSPKVEKQSKYVPTLRKLYNDEIVENLKKLLITRILWRFPRFSMFQLI